MITSKQFREASVGTLRTIAGVVAALLAIYGAMWSIGIAPITNGQAEDMFVEEIEKRTPNLASKHQLDNVTTKLLDNEEKIDDIQKDIEILRDSAARIDERSLRTYNELAEQRQDMRDFQNEVLRALRNN